MIEPLFSKKISAWRHRFQMMIPFIKEAFIINDYLNLIKSSRADIYESLMEDSVDNKQVVLTYFQDYLTHLPLADWQGIITPMPLLLQDRERLEPQFIFDLDRIESEKAISFRFVQPVCSNIYYVHQPTNSLLELINAKDKDNGCLTFRDYRFIVDFTDSKIINNWIVNL